ncbi:MAG: RagB/SusD family nutrient uptake outer membrane protein [Paludibacteraceae bacterium]
MKKIVYIVFVVVTVLFASCENFLDTENLTQKNTSNYPKTLTDAKQVLAGIYNNLSVTNAAPASSFLFYSELASDDRFGGGGVNDRMFQAEDLLMSSGKDMYAQFWKDRYAGIFRANTAIQTLGNCEGYTSDDEKNQIIGEAYFMRALYYYELASLFENIPLLTDPAPENKAQATPDETWGQIISDLKTAITMMPAKKYGTVAETGHADRWAAQAMMARAFLFYTGFYEKQDVTLPDGSKIAKTDVIAWIDDCIANSGYSLVSDFRNLWAYSNRLTKEDYAYTKGKNLKWVEDDNGINPESMFAIKFSKFASWGTTIGYSNGYALYLAIRGGQELGKTFPFGQGWGAGPVNPALWTDWSEAEPNDMRKVASICKISDELPNYTKGGWADFVQETDFYGKKWSPISSKKSDGSGYWETFEQEMYDYTTVNFQLSNIHDLVLIRFADVLLMQSELKGDATGMNKVRARAGLPPVAYSLKALQNERRWELNCEGVRWNDIRRWHIAETELAKQNNQPTLYQGVTDKNLTPNNGGGYVARYKATRGFVAIPETQISLSNNILKQNAGWGNDALYAGWK